MTSRVPRDTNRPQHELYVSPVVVEQFQTSRLWVHVHKGHDEQYRDQEHDVRSCDRPQHQEHGALVKRL